MPKNLKFEVFLEEFREASDLPEDSQTLISQAKQNCNNAYAPYSNFKVGAAVLLEDGTIVQGANQENGAFPSGLCAERVALFAAVSGYPHVPVKKLAVAASCEDESYQNMFIRPCGGCLQVIAEYQARQNKAIEILMASADGSVQVANSVEMLLPFTYSFIQPG